MINDLLDVITESNILVISTEVLDSIINLLNSSNYHEVRCSNDIKSAMKLFLASSPDLIIIYPTNNLTLSDLCNELNGLKSVDPLPPILLLTDNINSIPPINELVKDFISLPVNENEFLFRIHHLLTDHLARKEQLSYTQTIVDTIGQRNQDLKDSQIEVIECLGYAAEFRDSETGMHTIRVGHYSQCLAKAMGMNTKEAEMLLYCAPMHDVGKIGIPDNILLKPGKLEGKEWDIMKQHTIIGERILSRSKNKLLQQASIIALNHHEKWNGSGYPRGLSGSNIHLYGRIVAIVDVFDALTMERPYKKAWSIDDALELINSESDKHFDPTLVKLFISSLDEILSIKTSYADDKDDDNLLNEYLSIQ
ncbi:MAG: HD domain-containing phosphohydrolase [Methylococcaceae bacterium]